MKSVLIEAICVASAGAVLAFGLNALSPRGLKLSRNYFPSAFATPAAQSAKPGETSGTNSVIWQRLAAHGIQLVDSNFVAHAFNDPRRGAQLVVFIDARQDSWYQLGHIPGAYQLDYYRPEPHLPVVLPAAMAAETIIIYCNGGSCEDSEFAAIFLKDAGVSPDRLHVYGAGFDEWATNRMPVEIGSQNSGVLRTP